MAKDRVELNSICENFIKNTMDFYDIPGIAVGVYVSPDADCIADDMDVVPYMFTGAGGFRNYETKEPVEIDTVFHCTSVSKLFTAMGIMKLVEQGNLRLSDRLCDVVPWLSIADERWKDITIGMMLTHTSGLTDVNEYGWSEHRIDDNALKDYAKSEEVAGRKLLWEPADNKFRYSSKAYNLLGQVIAEVSGVTFEEFMQREIFEPLGMDDTTFLMPEETNLAMPHSKGRDRVIRLEGTYPYTRQHAPSSTLKSTTADLLKWASALMKCAPLREECVLHTETVQDMWRPRVEVPDTGEQMGLGWFIRKQKLPTGTSDAGTHYTLVGHEGSDDGFRTSLWMCPELGMATVLLCNLTDAPLKKLNKQLFDAIVHGI